MISLIIGFAVGAGIGFGLSKFWRAKGWAAWLAGIALMLVIVIIRAVTAEGPLPPGQGTLIALTCFGFITGLRKGN